MGDLFDFDNDGPVSEEEEEEAFLLLMDDDDEEEELGRGGGGCLPVFLLFTVLLASAIALPIVL